MNSVIPDISIIVPVYNTASYLVRCLDSIYQQPCPGLIEVIVLDAASTDNSLAVLEEYRATHNSLKIIRHEKRETLSTSRVVGMKAASGEYIMHVDSDDWLLAGSLEKIFSHIRGKNSQADAIVFNYVRTDSAGQVRELALFGNDDCTTDKCKVQKYFFSTCWNKVVRRSLVQDMIYGVRPITIEEDLIYSQEILLRANTVCLSTDRIYSYFVNVESLTNTIEPRHYMGMRVQQLEVLKELFIRYHADQKLRMRVFNYFEKFFHLELSRIYLFNGKKLDAKNKIVKELENVGILSEKTINRIKGSMDGKLKCLRNLHRFYGTKFLMWSLLRSATGYGFAEPLNGQVFYRLLQAIGDYPVRIIRRKFSKTNN